MQSEAEERLTKAPMICILPKKTCARVSEARHAGPVEARIIPPYEQGECRTSTMATVGSVRVRPARTIMCCANKPAVTADCKLPTRIAVRIQMRRLLLPLLLRVTSAGLLLLVGATQENVQRRFEVLYRSCSPALIPGPHPPCPTPPAPLPVRC